MIYARLGRDRKFIAPTSGSLCEGTQAREAREWVPPLGDPSDRSTRHGSVCSKISKISKPYKKKD